MTIFHGQDDVITLLVRCYGRMVGVLYTWSTAWPQASVISCSFSMVVAMDYGMAVGIFQTSLFFPSRPWLIYDSGHGRMYFLGTAATMVFGLAATMVFGLTASFYQTGYFQRPRPWYIYDNDRRCFFRHGRSHGPRPGRKHFAGMIIFHRRRHLSDKTIFSTHGHGLSV